MKRILESDNKITGHSISFIDIDETTMHTYAKVNVMKDGQKIRELDNKEFNTYSLNDGESYNFDNFRDAEYFNQTSKPIEKTINRIKNIIQSIKDNNKLEKVIFLTAREDFDNKEVFLDTFRKFGIDVDIPNVYIERSGNLKDIKKVADRKRYVILKYLQTGLYTAVRMFDDDMTNLKTFAQLGFDINDGKYGILSNVQKRYPRTKKVFFYPLLVNDDGSIKKISINENKKVKTNSMLLETTAYHGSHKDFLEFDTKFIGTGEKCQAHGWGLYFALTEKTSQEYAKRISDEHLNDKTNGTTTGISYNGKSYDGKSLQGVILKKILKYGKKTTINFLNKLEKESQFTKDPEKYLNDIHKLEEFVNNIDENKIKEQIKIMKGQFYTVEIPDLNTFLDEKQSIGEQNNYIIQKVKEILLDLNTPFKAKNLSGRSFYNKLKYYDLETGKNYDYAKNDPKTVSEFLYKYNISGIKYDGYSDGDCVVIFNKSDVKIVNKENDYISSENSDINFSEITKFIEDPKKLKGKRVSKEIIDWFIMNRPDLINDSIFLSKLDLEQRIKYVVYSNNFHNYNPSLLNAGLSYDEKTFNEMLEKIPENKLIQLSQFFSFKNIDNNLIKEYIEFIKSIPLEVRKKYILTSGDIVLQYGLRFVDSMNERVNIINEFYKGVTLNDVEKDSKKDTLSIYHNIDGYEHLLDDAPQYQYFYRDLEDTSYINLPIHITKLYLDMYKKLVKGIKYIRIHNNVDNEPYINEIRQLITPSENGVGILRADNINEYETYYTPIILDKLIDYDLTNNNDDPSTYNAIIDLIANYFPYKLEKYSTEDFIDYIKRTFTVKSFIKISEKETIEYWSKPKRIFIFEKLISILDNYDGYTNGEIIRNNFYNCIKSGLFNYFECINISIKKMPSLLQYFNLSYELQKKICSKNPYNIRFISHPDKKLVSELMKTNPDITGYIYDED